VAPDVNTTGKPGAGAGEELGRLLAELMDVLARPDGADGLSGLGGLAGLAELAGLGGLGGHAGIGGHAGHADLGGQAGPECRICPVCRAVAMLRQTRPEVLEHLVAAAGELAAAVRLVVTPPDAPEATPEAEDEARDEEPAAGEGGPEHAVRPGRARTGRQPVPVERIDVTD
jgi:hypothetical protein